MNKKKVVTLELETILTNEQVEHRFHLTEWAGMTITQVQVMEIQSPTDPPIEDEPATGG